MRKNRRSIQHGFASRSINLVTLIAITFDGAVGAMAQGATTTLLYPRRSHPGTGPLFSTVDAGFKTFIFDQEVGYRLLENSEKGASLDVLGGARVWRVKTDFEFGAGILPATRVEASRSWVDAVGGLRGKMALSEKLFLTGKFDLGGGGSKFTWQVFGGGGYNINRKIALTFGYRALDVNYDKNNFVYDMNQRGPIMGVGFRF